MCSSYISRVKIQRRLNLDGDGNGLLSGTDNCFVYFPDTCRQCEDPACGNACPQKAIVTKAKKSVANFKLREGMPIGAKVTLRGNKMWEFLDRLFNVALPRVRDFQGINPNSFDGRGNYALGIKEQLIFPEIEYDKIDKIRGLDVVICTTAKTDEEARELLKLMGAPFVTKA